METATTIARPVEPCFAELHRLPDGVEGVEQAICHRYFPYRIISALPSEKLFGAMAKARIGNSDLTRIYNSGTFHGHRPRAKSDERASFTLQLIEEGGSIEISNGRTTRFKQGDLLLINSRKPFSSQQIGAGISLGMTIDPAVIQSRFVNVDDWCLVPIDTSTGAASVLRETMQALWRQRHSFGHDSAQGVMDAVLQLIGAAFREQSSVPGSLSQANALHFMRLRDMVSANLDNAELSPAFLADRLNISKSFLFKLMARADTTLGRFVMERRLERARSMLADRSMAHRSISDIAFDVGFQELSHFSRRFAEHYGKSPRAFRVDLQRGH